MKGLYPKYTIIDNETGREVDGFAFVLKPEMDTCARAALRTYIEVVQPTNPQLAAELSYALQQIEAAMPAFGLGDSLTPNQQEALVRLRLGGAWELRNLGGITFTEMKILVKRGLAEYLGFSGASEFFQLAKPQGAEGKK